MAFIDRREALSRVLLGVTSLVFPKNLLGTQESDKFFKFNLAQKNPDGLNIDPSVRADIYRSAAKWLDQTLARSGGKLFLENDLGKYEIEFSASAERQGIDFAKALSRDIWRTRVAEKRKVAGAPEDDEIATSCEHILSLRIRYQNVPFAPTVYAADAEAGGRSFGTAEEMRQFNQIAEAHGLKKVDGPIRERAKFLKQIVDTEPQKLSDGSLYFMCMFNGHGAPGGRGMSLHSNGANFLSSLLSAREVGEAVKAHCEKWREKYEEAHKANLSAYIGVAFFCCYSQDQSRSLEGRGNEDLLSTLESVSAEHRVRPFVFTVGETMRPGYYQPGTVIPVLGVRSVIRQSDKEGVNGKLTLGNIYDIASGEGGILSNPTLFVVDRKTPRIYQIGEMDIRQFREGKNEGKSNRG